MNAIQWKLSDDDEECCKLVARIITHFHTLKKDSPELYLTQVLLSGIIDNVMTNNSHAVKALSSAIENYERHGLDATKLKEIFDIHKKITKTQNEISEKKEDLKKLFKQFQTASWEMQS